MPDPKLFAFSYFVPSLVCLVTSFLSALGTIPPILPLVTFILSSLYIMFINLTNYPLKEELKEKLKKVWNETDILSLVQDTVHLSRISSYFTSAFLLIVGFYIFFVPSPLSHKNIVLLAALAPTIFTPTPARIYQEAYKIVLGEAFVWRFSTIDILNPTFTDLLPSLALFFVDVLSVTRGIHWLVYELVFLFSLAFLMSFSSPY